MKLVCVKCQTRLRIKKNGVLTVDMLDNPPQDYEAFHGDMWECPGCNAQVVAGFGQVAVARFLDKEKMAMEIHTADSTGKLVRNYPRPVK